MPADRGAPLRRSGDQPVSLVDILAPADADRLREVLARLLLESARVDAERARAERRRLKGERMPRN